MNRGNLRKNLSRGAALLACVGALGACGSSEGNGVGGTGTCPTANGPNGIDFAAIFAIKDFNGADAQDVYNVDMSGLKADATKEFTFKISNLAPLISAKQLKIGSVKLFETLVSDNSEAKTLNFSCIGPGGADCATAVWPAIIPDGLNAACADGGAITVPQEFTVRYKKSAQQERHAVRVEITYEGDPKNKGPKNISIVVAFGLAKIKCTPELLDFGQVKLSDAATDLTVGCHNGGTAAGEITAAQLLEGPEGLAATVSFGGVSIDSKTPYAGTPKVSIAPGDTLTLSVHLTALKSEGKHTGTLIVSTNDPGNSLIKTPIFVNTTGTCIKSTPGLVDFESVGVGQKKQLSISLQNCGTGEVPLTSIAFPKDSPAELSVEFGFGFSGPPSEAKPRVLQQNEAVTVYINFSPTQVDQNVSGKLQVLYIDDTKSTQTKAVDVTGKGNKLANPVTCMVVKNKITSKEIPSGGQSVPQNPITVDAACAKAIDPHIIKSWKWTMTNQPPGSFATFLPSDNKQQASFVPNVVGKYTFKLEVKDDAGTPGSPAPLLFDLNIIPDDKMHVELTWDAPGDKDQTDADGVDLDLHLACPDAFLAKMPDTDGNGEPDPWNNACDCWNLNPKPVCAQDAPNANAHIDLDDQNGQGPENINVQEPQSGKFYHIGVRAWYGKKSVYGLSTPHVKLYLGSTGIAYKDILGPPMDEGDMWYVGLAAYDPSVFKAPKGADANGILLTHKYPTYKNVLPPCAQ